MKLSFLLRIIFISPILWTQISFARLVKETQSTSTSQLKTPQRHQYLQKKYQFRLGIAQENKESFESLSELTKTQLDLNLLMPLSENLNVAVEPGFQFNTGSQQGIYSIEKPTNRLVFSNAEINLKTSQSTFSRFGAINQKQFHNSLLIDAEALPTLALGIHDSNDNSIIVSTTQLEFINRAPMTGTFQKNPWLTSVNANYQTSQFFKISAGIFLISQTENTLTGNVLQTGNHYMQISDGIYQLSNDFSGTEFQIQINTPQYNLFSFHLEFEGLTNQMAEPRQNGAYLIGGRTQLQLDKDAQMTYRASYFESEPEATIGTLIENIGGGNRIGFSQEISYESKKIGYKLSIGMRELIPMYNQTLQTPEKQLTFKLETLYVEI